MKRRIVGVFIVIFIIISAVQSHFFREADKRKSDLSKVGFFERSWGENGSKHLGLFGDIGVSSHFKFDGIEAKRTVGIDFSNPSRDLQKWPIDPRPSEKNFLFAQLTTVDFPSHELSASHLSPSEGRKDAGTVSLDFPGFLPPEEASEDEVQGLDSSSSLPKPDTTQAEDEIDKFLFAFEDEVFSTAPPSQGTPNPSLRTKHGNPVLSDNSWIASFSMVAHYDDSSFFCTTSDDEREEDETSEFYWDHCYDTNAGLKNEFDLDEFYFDETDFALPPSEAKIDTFFFSDFKKDLPEEIHIKNTKNLYKVTWIDDAESDQEEKERDDLESQRQFKKIGPPVAPRKKKAGIVDNRPLLGPKSTLSTKGSTFGKAPRWTEERL